MKLIDKQYFAVILALFVAVAPSTAFSEERSAIVMLSTAISLQGDSIENNDPAKTFSANLVIEKIIASYPTSVTALRLKKNRIRNLDVEKIRHTAAEWRSKHPDRARVIEEGYPHSIWPETEVAKLGGSVRGIKPDQDRFDGNEGGKAAPATPPPQTDLRPDRKFTHMDQIDVLRNALVIVARLERREDGYSVKQLATGFFINQNHVLTNQHVVDGADRFVLSSYRFGSGVGTVVAKGQVSRYLGIDAAVLKVDGRLKNMIPLSLAHSVTQGESLAMGGFPDVDRRSEGIRSDYLSYLANERVPPRWSIPQETTEHGGYVGKVGKWQSDYTQFQHTLESTKGSSGSPLINACGHLVGIHYGSSDHHKRRNSNRNDNSKYNFAFSAKSLREFLTNNGIKFRMADHPCNQG